MQARDCMQFRAVWR